MSTPGDQDHTTEQLDQFLREVLEPSPDRDAVRDVVAIERQHAKDILGLSDIPNPPERVTEGELWKIDRAGARLCYNPFNRCLEVNLTKASDQTAWQNQAESNWGVIYKEPFSAGDIAGLFNKQFSEALLLEQTSSQPVMNIPPRRVYEFLCAISLIEKYKPVRSGSSVRLPTTLEFRYFLHTSPHQLPAGEILCYNSTDSTYESVDPADDDDIKRYDPSDRFSGGICPLVMLTNGR